MRERLSWLFIDSQTNNTQDGPFENQRPDELILFADELDIDLLPKVGYQWMLKGTQLEIRTPGKNQKHYLAAALNPATGQTYYVMGPQ
jgi:putative transposase